YFRLLKRIDNMDSSPTISLGWTGSGGFYLFSPQNKWLYNEKRGIFPRRIVPLIYYTRVTLPDFNARADTQTFFGFPSTKMRTFCRLAPHFLRVAFIAWERRLPKDAFLPVITHFFAILIPPHSINRTKNEQIY